MMNAVVIFLLRYIQKLADLIRSKSAMDTLQGQSSSANLLKNGDMEADWSQGGSHRCHVFPVGKASYFAEIGNIFSPPSWIFWYKHQAEKWDQPEGRDAWRQNAPERVLGGQKAFMWFTFYRNHHAGLYQQVKNVEPGRRLRATAWMHAWSNGLSAGQGGHLDNGRWSDGAGYDFVAWKSGTLPDDTGDPQTDAKPNFTFRIGIDPTGGTDPFGASVVWGDGWHIYNGYVRQLEVEAIARSSMVTVFVESKTRWPFKHNDAYLENVELTMLDEPGPEPEPEPEPEERGEPREQYERVYVLLPPAADAKIASTVMGFTWDKHRYTIGGSADDAGLGDLDNRFVIALRPGEWEPGEDGRGLAGFFERYYPGVTYWPIEFDNDFQLQGRLLACSLKRAGLALAFPSTNEQRRITDGFGGWRTGSGVYHCGLDIASSWAAWKDEVLSATDGEVIEAGWSDNQGGFGYRVRIKTVLANGTEVFVRYAHFVGDGVYVDVGDTVQVGQKLGKPDSTGSSSGDHLHIDVAVEGSYADPEMLIDFISDVPVVGPEPGSGPPDVWLPSSARGVHDESGGEWMIANGVGGWCLFPIYLNTFPITMNALERYRKAGIAVVLNLRYSYAVDDGGRGTMPIPGSAEAAAFEMAVIQTIKNNPAAWGFVIANEMNNPREWPKGDAITPEDYRKFYNRVYQAVPRSALLSPGGIDPFNPGWGDWRATWRSVLEGLAGVEFLALHTYTHGWDVARVSSTQQFEHDPLRGVYFDLRVLESQQEVIPARFAGLPQVITETNPDADGVFGWPNDGEWVRAAYGYFAQRGISGACLFRFNYDKWQFGDKAGVLKALKAI